LLNCVVPYVVNIRPRTRRNDESHSRILIAYAVCAST
jgi:hypothetical protein